MNILQKFGMPIFMGLFILGIFMLSQGTRTGWAGSVGFAVA